MRPIDADDLLWCYKKRMDIEGLRHRKLVYYLKGIRDCIKDLESRPTIEPEQKAGQWICKDRKKCECSRCGFILDNVILGALYNYCPNCGAFQWKDLAEEGE